MMQSKTRVPIRTLAVVIESPCEYWKEANMRRIVRVSAILAALGTLIYSVGAPWWSGG
jgi:hypothetical protein